MPTESPHHREGIALAAAALAALALYALLAHRLIVSADRSALAYLFAMSTLYVAAIAFAWSSRRRWGWIAAATAAFAIGWQAQQRIDWDPRWIYLVQHAGAHGALGIVFGSTLRRGVLPLVTRLALAVHGALPPAIAHHTRRVTVAWTVYFAAMTAASIGLFAAGWMTAWSVLANFLTPPAIVALFVGEYLLRRRRFPDFAHVPLLEGVRAYARRGRGGTAR
ncbi:MAG TPA: acyl carrier protein [Burkholderiaceae bacterium]|nr:acyl carrier protein [Burkholderiaceae bacterium]